MVTSTECRTIPRALRVRRPGYHTAASCASLFEDFPSSSRPWERADAVALLGRRKIATEPSVFPCRRKLGALLIRWRLPQIQAWIADVHRRRGAIEVIQLSIQRYARCDSGLSKWSRAFIAGPAIVEFASHSLSCPLAEHVAGKRRLANFPISPSILSMASPCRAPRATGGMVKGVEHRKVRLLWVEFAMHRFLAHVFSVSASAHVTSQARPP